MNNEFKAHIDTIEIGVLIDNIANNYLVYEDARKIFGYAKTIGNNVLKADNELKIQKRIKLNLNNRIGYCRLNRLKEFNKQFNASMNDLEIVNSEEVTINRIDIAMDSNIDFHSNFKLLLFLFESITLNKKDDKWYTTNLKTLKFNNIINRSNIFEVVFYDKEDESKRTHQFKTRMEFRFKRTSSQDFNMHITKLISRLEYLDDNIEALEKDMSKRLIKFWNIEKSKLNNFSAFVKMYDRYFYTSNILKEVHKCSGLKGKYQNWLREFNRNNSKLVFYTKKDIKNLQRNMLKAMKYYKK